MTTCALCGVVAADDQPPITWTSAVEQAQTRWFCDSCSREHLRSIEARLDSEWW